MTIKTVERCLTVLRSLPSTSTGNSVIEALSTEKWERLWNGEIPFPDAQLDSFPIEYFAYNLLRKYPFRGVDRKAVALSAFADAEASCHDANTRILTLFRNHGFFCECGKCLSGSPFIQRAREKIEKLLGPFCWNQAAGGFSHGPGATTRLKNEEGDVYYKFSGKPETTLFNLPAASAAVRSIPLWYEDRKINSADVPDSFPDFDGETYTNDSEEELLAAKRQYDLDRMAWIARKGGFSVVPGSKITTVPKNAKTDRTIAIEPCMNMYVQKGIGRLIRGRLRRVGIDLNDQGLNQELAKVAERDGLATVDLSAASDTVSYELVKLLLPDDWFMALERCRSPRYVLGREIKTFAKYSTMGNGYTFELESLLFWAITSCAIEASFVADKRIGIYGDDIICHSLAVPVLKLWLGVLGFKLNMDKSFVDGPFRESCGKHFWRGSEVTPIYVDDEVVSPRESTWFANSVLYWTERMHLAGSPVGLMPWTNSLQYVSPSHCLPIPRGMGEGGIVLPNLCPLPLRRAKEALWYQRGANFKHHVLRRVNSRRLDPSDVPFYLRGLKRIAESPSLEFLVGNDYFSRRMQLWCVLEEDRGLSTKEEEAVVRGWTSSWDVPIIV